MMTLQGEIRNVEREEPRLMKGRTYRNKNKTATERVRRYRGTPKLNYRVIGECTTLLDYHASHADEFEIEKTFH